MPPFASTRRLLPGLLLALPAQAVDAQADGGSPRAVAHVVAPVVDSPARLPFAVGERLTYRARVAKAGNVGRGEMWIEGPVDVRGTSTYLLRFDFKAGVGPVKAEDRTSSWLDATRMASLRFAKHERHPLSNSDQRVEILPEERRWRAEDGEAGTSLSDVPLDELSFMYFLRTLPLDADTVFRFDRHFDPARNPTIVRVVRRDTIQTAAGTFRVVLLEMRVRDARHYKGEGVIRIYQSDDACRIPVRIESGMPVIGTAVLTLESVSGACWGAAR